MLFRVTNRENCQHVSSGDPGIHGNSRHCSVTLRAHQRTETRRLYIHPIESRSLRPNRSVNTGFVNEHSGVDAIDSPIASCRVPPTTPTTHICTCFKNRSCKQQLMDGTSRSRLLSVSADQSGIAVELPVSSVRGRRFRVGGNTANTVMLWNLQACFDNIRSDGDNHKLVCLLDTESKY